MPRALTSTDKPVEARPGLPTVGDVIISGGRGFIGRALARRIAALQSPGARLFALGSHDVDLTNANATFDWFERAREGGEVTHIFHLAAVYKAGGWPAHHPATQFYANMALNINMLEAWRRVFPKARFTSVVSYCMYPDHDQPHPESEMYGTEPEAYLYAYAFTKKALVIGQRAYCQEFGLSAGSAVLPTIYGPGDSFAEDSHVMGALIGKFSRAAASGHPTVEVWGDGSQEREFLFVEDAVDGILAVAASGANAMFNVGTGEGVPVRRIAEIIADEVGFGGKIDYALDRFVGAKRRVLSIDAARRELGWCASTSLRDGIRATIATYRPGTH